MKGIKNKLMLIIGCLFIIIGLLIIFFNIPYSSLKNEFNNDLEQTIQNTKIEKDVFTEDDFRSYPLAIKKYITNNGFIGNQKMSYLNIFFENTDFIQDPKKIKLKIDYNQYNFAKRPARLAYINSSIYGIPFEGYDYFFNEIGGMKGVIGKKIQIFNQKGSDIDKGALCTYLAESLFIPTSLLENDIIFEEIDPFNVKATINLKGISVSGVFTFNEEYEMIKFYTEDRAAVKDDGSVDYIPWTAKCDNYKRNKDGINFPNKLKAIWNYPDKDLIYFDGNVKYFSFK